MVREDEIRTTGAESMKILMLIPYICRSGGGVSEAARLLALGLRGVGCDISVVTLVTPHLEEDRAGWDGIDIRAYPRRGPSRLGFAPGMFRDLADADADVVHVHGLWQMHCLAALGWHRRTGWPYIVTPHGMLERWIMLRSPYQKKIFSALFQDRFLRRATRIHVLTPKEKEDVAITMGTLPVTEVPNFLPDREPAQDKPGWWTPAMEGRRVFLFLGRVHDKKGWRELCAAWAARCLADPEFRAGAFLVFCGWLDDVPDFEGVIADLAARFGNILYAGPQYGDAKFKSYEAADFFILPSKSEGLPMVVLEAWQASALVIMTDACNLSNAFDADAALRIGESAEEIEIGLATAFTLSESDHRKMAASAQAFLGAHYGEESVVNQMLALYREVARDI